MKRIVVAICLLLVFAVTGPAEADMGLADLIQGGQSQAALKAISAGADVNRAQGDGTTPLHWAVYRVEPELVGALLARGARPNVVNSFGASPLVEAVKIADRGLVEMLLKAGANANAATNEDGQTALMVAAGLGAMEIAELLVRNGANVNAKEQWRGQTPLMWAAAENHPDIAELLIAKGADVDVRAKANDWPTQFTSEPRAQYRPDGGLTPLMYAARGACLRCVKAMVEAGANVNRPDPDGITPLMVAIDNSSYDIAKYLLEHGANPHTWDWYGRTPLYVAVDMRARGDRYGSSGSDGGRGSRRGADRRPACPARTQCQGATAWDVFQMLLDAGVDPSPQLTMHRPGGRNGDNGRFSDDLLTTGATPLLRAAQAFDNDVVRALLKAGAPVDLPNVMGVTPFLAAAGIDNDRGGADGAGYRGDKEAGAISTMEILLAAGADVNDRVRDTSSYTARISRRSSMTDRQGQTALFGAAQGARMKVVRFLLDHGAKVDVADDRGKTPLDAAVGDVGGREQGGSKEILALFRSLSSKSK